MYLTDSKLTPRNFYKGLLEQLGYEAKFYRGDSKQQLHKEIEMMRGVQHIQPVVIVDEAHFLGKEMLEEVRFLFNFKLDSVEPHGTDTGRAERTVGELQLQAYAAIRQRIDLQCKLPHLDRSQTEAYIEKHLAYAGTENVSSPIAHSRKFSLFQRNAPNDQQDLYPLSGVWRAKWSQDY